MVAVLKLLLPAAAAALVLLVAIWPIISSRTNGSGSTSKPRAAAMPKIKMENPRYTSASTSSNQPFAVTADRHEPPAPRAMDVEPGGAEGRHSVVGRHLGGDHGAQRISTTAKPSCLTLETATSICSTTSGYEFRTEQRASGPVGGNAHGAEPVEGQGPFGHLSAEGFQVFDRGSRDRLHRQSPAW